MEPRHGSAMKKISFFLLGAGRRSDVDGSQAVGPSRLAESCGLLHFFFFFFFFFACSLPRQRGMDAQKGLDREREKMGSQRGLGSLRLTGLGPENGRENGGVSAPFMIGLGCPLGRERRRMGSQHGLGSLVVFFF